MAKLRGFRDSRDRVSTSMINMAIKYINEGNSELAIKTLEALTNSFKINKQIKK